MTSSAILTSKEIRDQFFAFSGCGLSGSHSKWTLLNNAANSQIPKSVEKRRSEFLTYYFTNQFEPSPISQESTEKLKHARSFVKIWINCLENGEIVFGQSATLLVRILTLSFAKMLIPGDEIIIGNSNHECNYSPWLDLEKNGIIIKIWDCLNINSDEYSLDQLLPLITERTKILAFEQTSNLLGNVRDCKRIIQEVRQISHNIRIVVDGAQYVPHKCPDVHDMNCDFYYFSGYKAFAPGMGILYGKNSAFDELPGYQNHFQPNITMAKFELGFVFQADGLYAMLGLNDYFKFLIGDSEYNTKISREIVIAAYKVMESFEEILLKKLLNYLLSKSCFVVYGSHSTSMEHRVGIISFLHKTITPQEIQEKCAKQFIYVRPGHLQAYRICEYYNIDLSIGILRVSVLHYNTIEEIDSLICVLDSL